MDGQGIVTGLKRYADRQNSVTRMSVPGGTVGPGTEKDIQPFNSLSRSSNRPPP